MVCCRQGFSDRKADKVYGSAVLQCRACPPPQRRGGAQTVDAPVLAAAPEAGGVPDPKSNPFLTEFIKNHEYTTEEKIINLCDLMCPQGGKVYTIDKRLIDIMIRRGAYSNTQYHIKETYKLKEYFDNLLGYNLYDLFPEIKENL